MPSKNPADDIEIEIDEAPTSIDPYAVLGLTEAATEKDVTKAYRKAALTHHPDKAAPEDKDVAHKKFQEIAFAYAILSDERRRRRYDTTGSTEEVLDEDDDFDWFDFYREQFNNAVTVESITNFSNQYKGSEEERGHVLAAYDKFEGNMSKLYQGVMLSDVLEDDERFRGIIDAAIAEGEVEAHDKYTNETEKSKQARIATAQKKRDKDRQDVEKAAKKAEASGKAKAAGKKGAEGDLGDLAAMIQKRQNDRSGNFLDKLEEKYASKSKRAGSKRPAADEPSEEAFAKNAKRGKTRAR